MAGVKKLRKMQLGKESAAGTAVAATAVWRGTGMGNATNEVSFPEEDVGYLMPLSRSYIGQIGAELTMDETPATFEQLPYIFEAGVAAEVATQDGAGSDYIYQYLLPTTSLPTYNTYTIEYGDNQQAYEMEYGHVSEFTISGEPGDAVMVEATWIGRQESTSTFTSLSVPAVEEILFQKGTLDIDGVGTFPATTNIANQWLGFELSYTTGLIPKFTGDGNLYFSFTQQVGPEVELQLTFEHDTTAVAEIATWKAETPRSIRMEFTGSAVATPGTTYSNQTFIIDLVGLWSAAEPIGDTDGNDTRTLTLRCGYDGTAASAGKFIVVNELSALT